MGRGGARERIGGELQQTRLSKRRVCWPCTVNTIEDKNRPLAILILLPLLPLNVKSQQTRIPHVSERAPRSPTDCVNGKTTKDGLL